MIVALCIAGAALYLAIGVWISKHFLAALTIFSLTLAETRAGLSIVLRHVSGAVRSRVRYAILGEDIVEIRPVCGAYGGFSFLKVRWMTKPRWWQLWRLAAWKRCEGQPSYVYGDGLVVRMRPLP